MQLLSTLPLGVVNNQSMPKYVRFNAQQAILLDILLIVPDVLTRLVSGMGGDDAMLTGGPGLEVGLYKLCVVLLVLLQRFFATSCSMETDELVVLLNKRLEQVESS
jgi:hypothetical protein